MLPFYVFRKLYYTAGLIVLTILIGIAGYRIIEGYTFAEAFYMTIITVGTVGFMEVHPLSDGGRMFTALLIIMSFGTFAYAISSLTHYIGSGEFRYFYRNYRTVTAIDKLSGHVIICGYGRNGRQAAHVLKKHDQRFVVVDNNREIVEAINHRYANLVLEGDATQDETLEKAGIARASAIITTLPTDADNVFIVLTARSLNERITIISRASDDNSDKKLKKAGANNVIMPDKIGGAHMASLVLKPDVIEFIDYITGQGGPDINLEEITFESLPDHLHNKTIRDLEIRNKSGANIVGFKTDKGEFVINPSPDTQLIPNVKLFVLGTPEQIRKLKEIFVHTV